MVVHDDTPRSFLYHFDLIPAEGAMDFAIIMDDVEGFEFFHIVGTEYLPKVGVDRPHPGVAQWLFEDRNDLGLGL